MRSALPGVRAQQTGGTCWHRCCAHAARRFYVKTHALRKLRWQNELSTYETALNSTNGVKVKLTCSSVLRSMQLWGVYVRMYALPQVSHIHTLSTYVYICVICHAVLLIVLGQLMGQCQKRHRPVVAWPDSGLTALASASHQEEAEYLQALFAASSWAAKDDPSDVAPADPSDELIQSLPVNSVPRARPTPRVVIDRRAANAG